MTNPVVPYLIHAIRNAVTVTQGPGERQRVKARKHLAILLDELDEATR